MASTPIRSGVTLVAAVMAFCLTACAPADAGQLKVSARSPAGFSAWQSHAGKRFTTDEEREWRDVLQDLRYDIMARHEASGSDAVEQRLRERVDGQTINAVRKAGLTLRCNRLAKEREQLQRNVKYRLKTAPGDTASSRYLDQQNQILRERLATVETELAQAESRLNALLGLPSS